MGSGSNGRRCRPTLHLADLRKGILAWLLRWDLFWVIKDDSDDRCHDGMNLHIL